MKVSIDTETGEIVMRDTPLGARFILDGTVLLPKADLELAIEAAEQLLATRRKLERAREDEALAVGAIQALGRAA